MYTTTWCVFCKSLKRTLAYDGIELAEVDIEQDPAAAAFVESVNGGNQTVPTLLFPDGTTMVNPTAAQVKAHLGVGTPQGQLALARVGIIPSERGNVCMRGGEYHE
jgi:mycoredoxin